MTTRLTLAGIIVGALAMPGLAQRPAGGDHARPPGPELIAHRSIRQIHLLTQHGVQMMHRQAAMCSRVIAHLLENDETERAAEVAERCIGGIDGVAERGGEVISRIAERAVTALTELEAPAELIDAVQTAAQMGLASIEEQRASSVQIVQDALGGSPPE